MKIISTKEEELSGEGSAAVNLIEMLSVKTAKDLALDMNIVK